jgi:hypothetical protein
MVEIMEPTDFVARLEFNVAGRVVPKPSRFMGRDVDFALDMLSFEPMPANAVQSRWRCESRTLEKSARLHQEALVDGRVTDRFNVLRTSLFRMGWTSWKSMLRIASPSWNVYRPGRYSKTRVDVSRTHNIQVDASTGERRPEQNSMGQRDSRFALDV